MSAMSNKETEEALAKLLELAMGDPKPREYAEALADFLDRIPRLSEWAKKIREARFDGDRLKQLLDEFEKFTDAIDATGAGVHHA